MFTATEIQARVRSMPFAPFRIVTSSGAIYEVTHPEAIFVGRRDVLLSRSGNASPETDQVDQLSILHITAMEAMPVRQRIAGPDNE